MRGLPKTDRNTNLLLVKTGQCLPSLEGCCVSQMFPNGRFVCAETGLDASPRYPSLPNVEGYFSSLGF